MIFPENLDFRGSLEMLFVMLLTMINVENKVKKKCNILLAQFLINYTDGA